MTAAVCHGSQGRSLRTGSPQTGSTQTGSLRTWLLVLWVALWISAVSGEYGAPPVPLISTYYPLNLIDVVLETGQPYESKYSKIFINSLEALKLNTSLSDLAVSVHFGVTPVLITELQVQGGFVTFQSLRYPTYPTFFEVAYSLDGIVWTKANDGQAYEGPSDTDTVATVSLKPPILALKLRVTPKGWVLGGQPSPSRILGLRLEVLGSPTCRP